MVAYIVVEDQAVIKVVAVNEVVPQLAQAKELIVFMEARHAADATAEIAKHVQHINSLVTTTNPTIEIEDSAYESFQHEIKILQQRRREIEKQEQTVTHSMSLTSRSFVQRNIDAEKQNPSTSTFDKSLKYQGQILKDDTEHRVGGEHRSFAGPMQYQGKTAQKKRFILPTSAMDYFTYYCYDIIQFAGINTPKYRYAKNIVTEDNVIHPYAQVSELIPKNKIPMIDIQAQDYIPDDEHKTIKDQKFLLDKNQFFTNITMNTEKLKVAGHPFGAHLMGLLLQNPDMGKLNGYFVEKNGREHFYAIDMGLATFATPDKLYYPDEAQNPTSWLIKSLVRSDSGKSYSELATHEQIISMISSIDKLLDTKTGRSPLERIYYNPRAIDMYFDLAPEIGAHLLSAMAEYGYSQFKEKGFTAEPCATQYPWFNEMLIELKGKISQQKTGVPHTKEGMEQLCKGIRDLAESYGETIYQKMLGEMEAGGNRKAVTELKDDRDDYFTEFNRALAYPIYSPDLQIQAIRENGVSMVTYYTKNDPSVLVEFKEREQAREKTADAVLQELGVTDEDQKSAIKKLIVEDLKGKYYEKYYSDIDQDPHGTTIFNPALVMKLAEDFRKELGLTTTEIQKNTVKK